MKNKLAIIAAICAVFFLSSCTEQRANNVIPNYPFKTLHGKWIRNGNIGAMGVTKLNSYEKKHMEFMEWTVQDEVLVFVCQNIQNPRPGLHTFEWHAYDESATPKINPDVAMRIKVGIAGQNDIYVVTDAAGMGGLTMARVN